MASKDGSSKGSRPKRGRKPNDTIPYVNSGEVDVFEGEAPTKKKSRKSSSASSNRIEQQESEIGTGCNICGLDNDHGNLLLCEVCNGEYHTYCLRPPLKSIPENEWFCDKCKQVDNLEIMIASLPDSYISRFGEIVWAQGGVGYGWWPACIYDPRLTLGKARIQATKSLGKKHLVYFFECVEAPFEILPDSKIMAWEQGLVEDCHLGKSLRASSKRFLNFKSAVHAATIEETRPLETRMDWNHQGAMALAQHSSSNTNLPPRRKPEPAKSTKKESSKSGKKREKKSRRDSEGGSSEATVRSKKKPSSKPRSHSKSDDSGELYCKILRANDKNSKGVTVGFVRTRSRSKSTFTHLRRVVQHDLVPEAIPHEWDWRFYIPGVGPLSQAQESKFGPVLNFLQQIRKSVGEGTLDSPIEITVIPAPPKPSG